ncbi:MAG: hypothetical protein ACJ74J_12870 [Blastocatellia bacterium]
MEQVGASLYIVESDETVTLTVTPVQVGPFVKVGVNDSLLENQDGATPVFSFPITKPAGGNQIADVFCNFPGNPPDTAEYDIQVSGSNGGDFVGPVVVKTDQLHTIEISFHIAEHAAGFIAAISAPVRADTSRGAAAKKGGAKKASGAAKGRKNR